MPACLCTWQCETTCKNPNTRLKEGAQEKTEIKLFSSMTKPEELPVTKHDFIHGEGHQSKTIHSKDTLIIVGRELTSLLQFFLKGLHIQSVTGAVSACSYSHDSDA